MLQRQFNKYSRGNFVKSLYNKKKSRRNNLPFYFRYNKENHVGFKFPIIVYSLTFQSNENNREPNILQFVIPPIQFPKKKKKRCLTNHFDCNISFRFNVFMFSLYIKCNIISVIENNTELRWTMVFLYKWYKSVIPSKIIIWPRFHYVI